MITERRTQERISSEQAATLYLESGESYACVIADFCGQGMYITYTANALGLSEDNRVIRVSFVDELGKEFFVNAEPRHVTSQAAGLRFLNSYPHVVENLTKRFANRETPDISAVHRLVIERCLQQSDIAITAALEGVLPEIVQSFQQSAIKASTDQDANARMSIAERVEKHSSSIISKARNDILSFDSLALEFSQHEENESNLSIIEKVEFEDWLIARVLITRLESHFRTDLLLLKMRTDAMNYNSPIASSSPLGPERAVYAFRSAIHHFVNDPTLEKLAFKLYEKALHGVLDELYQKLNSTLEAEGILADKSLSSLAKEKVVSPDLPESKDSEPSVEDEALNDSAQTTASNASVNAKPASETSGPIVDSVSESNSSQQSPSSSQANRPFGYRQQSLNHAGVDQGNISASNITGKSSPVEPGVDQEQIKEAQSFSIFRNILSSFSSKKTAQIDDSVSAFSSNELNEGLAQKQIPTRSLDSDGEALSLLSRVLQSLNTGEDEEKALSHEQQGQVDVIDRFFGSLQNNPRISSEGKQHLFRLEIPVLRQLLENDTFFEDQNSPLRDVLNRIAKLGAQGNRLGRVGHQKISALLERISTELNENPGVIDEVKTELDALMVKQHSQYLKNVERVATAADNAHRLEDIRAELEQRIVYLLDGDVPVAVEEMLNSGWLDFLQLEAVKHGIDSDQVKNGFQALNALIQFGRKPESGFEAKKYVPFIQQGLMQISGGQDVAKSVRESLKNLVLDAQHNQHKMIPGQTLPLVSDIKKADRENTNKEKSERLVPWIKRAKSIPLNAWMRFDKDGESTQFIRLVWIAKGYSKFVFVNHQGLKVIELGLLKLSEYLKLQSITPDPNYDQSLVKQGLDDMVKDVYERLALGASTDQLTGLQTEDEFRGNVRRRMQSGERTSPCAMMLIRCLLGELPESLENKAVEAIGEVLRNFEADQASVARLNRYDFAIFISGKTLNEQIAQAKEIAGRTAQIGVEFDTPFVVLSSEVRGYLGFHNERSLLSSAEQSLRKIDRKVSGDVQVELSQTESASSRFAIDDLSYFQVMAQPVKNLSNNPISDHLALSCIESDADSNYLAVNKDEGVSINSWWLNYIDARLNQNDIGVGRIPIHSSAFFDENFSQSLQKVLMKGHIAADDLWFEIYDLDSVSNPYLVADLMMDLQNLGVKFSLAGYGTKQCSPDLVELLPIDSVTMAANTLQSSQELEETERSLIELAQHFGKLVIVSNVDSAIAMQKAKIQGADFAQGERVGPAKEYS
ncbi:MAG: DUF1631 family protein [Oleiphilaceae bacterium]|nr:DUF1631 family protein [Oleiphilaceae bacterium]